MLLADDRATEYERLCVSLDRRRIAAFACQSDAVHVLHGGGRREPRVRHLIAVGELAVKYVGLLYRGEDAAEKRYQCMICEAAGLLHEAMVQSRTFEELVEVSDEATAGIVSALTPDLREPAPKRLRLLANRIGLAGPEAQLVTLADLRHEFALVSAAPPDRKALAWLADAVLLLGHLRRLQDTPLYPRVQLLRRGLVSLDRRLSSRR